MWKDDEKFKSFFALLIGIFFAIIISEIFLQVIKFPASPVSGWLNCKNKNPGQCNSMGFRGREIAYLPDDFVVILLGDSEVYQINLPFEQLPEYYLEHFLRKYRDNVKVISIADMGYGQDQQYLALKRYFRRHRADLVLLMYTARNDIDNNIFPVEGGNKTIKPTFWLENDELRGPTERWLDTVGPRIKLLLLWKSYIGKTMGELRLEKWKNDYLPPSYQPFINYQGEIDYFLQEELNRDPDNVLKAIENERISFNNQLTPTSEMRKYGINLSRKLFSEINKLVEAQHGHFIIFKEERPWELKENDREKVFVLNDKYYKISMKQYKDNLKNLFEGFEVYRIPLNADNYTARKGDAHLNLSAITLLMKDLSRIISKKEYFYKK
jgi:hypothetical protein